MSKSSDELLNFLTAYEQAAYVERIFAAYLLLQFCLNEYHMVTLDWSYVTHVIIS